MTDANRPKPVRTRVLELSAGIVSLSLVGHAFDYVLYPYVIYRFGFLKGGVVMAFLSCLVCIGSIKLYDFLKRDWFGLEAIKELKTYEGDNRMRRITARIMRKSDPVVFAFLSIKFDPFITTTYLRRERYSGLAKRDVAIFLGSLVLGNAYWAFVCISGISLFEWVKAMAGIVLA